MSNEPFEKLRHGKALCGKVFRTFVETFNWHTDFCRNLKGDGDVGQGFISVDRSDPRHPVIRLNPGSGSGDDTSNSFRHWTFSCAEDPDTHERTGGWKNKVVQIGLSLYNFDESTSRYTDDTGCQDGRYYLEVSYNTDGAQGAVGPKAEVKIMTGSPQPDLQSGKCYFYLGTVQDGKLTYGTHSVPVVYYNLA